MNVFTRSTTINGLPSPSSLMTSQPQPIRVTKRSASPEWYYDKYYNMRSKVARRNRNPQTDSIRPVAFPLPLNNSLSQMKLGYILDRETDSVLPVTPPLEAKDSLSRMQLRNVLNRETDSVLPVTPPPSQANDISPGTEHGYIRCDTPHPNFGFYEPGRDRVVQT